MAATLLHKIGEGSGAIGTQCRNMRHARRCRDGFKLCRIAGAHNRDARLAVAQEVLDLMGGICGVDRHVYRAHMQAGNIKKY